MKDYSAQATKYKKSEISFGAWFRLFLAFGLVLSAGISLLWIYSQPSNNNPLVDTNTKKELDAPKSIQSFYENLENIQSPISAEKKNGGIEEINSTSKHNVFKFHDILINNPIKINIKSEEKRQAEEIVIAKQLERKRVQVASFQSKRQAESIYPRLLLLGFEEHLITLESGTNGWHKILVGPFPTSRDLAAAKDKLSNNGFAGYIEKVRR